MNIKDVVIIILLFVILAIVIRIMQALKLQMELTRDIAIKAGIVVSDKNCKNCEDEEEEKQEEEEIEALEEDQNGNKISDVKAVVVKEKKRKYKSRKKRPVDLIEKLITDKPLKMKEIMNKYEDMYGRISDNQMWHVLNLAVKNGKIKKFTVGPNRYVYGLPEMFENQNN